jgi:hypothetical protein
LLKRKRVKQTEKLNFALMLTPDTDTTVLSTAKSVLQPQVRGKISTAFPIIPHLSIKLMDLSRKILKNRSSQPTSIPAQSSG